MTSLDTYVKQAAPNAKGSLREELVHSLLRYLFSTINYSQMRKEFQGLAGVDFTRDIRNSMVRDPSVMYNVKFPIYLAVTSSTKAKARDLAKKNNLHLKDVTLLDHVFDSDLRDELAELAEKYRPLTIERFRSEIERAWLINQANSLNFVRFKLRFLCNWGLQIPDLVADCTGSAYHALLLQYPHIQSRVHLNNLYKQSLRQAGLKLIAYYTSQNRSVFDTSGNLRRFSIDYDNPDSDQTSDLLGTSQVATGLYGGDYMQQGQLENVRTVLLHGGLDKSEEKLVMYLMGETDEIFETWLKKKYKLSPSRALPKTYLKACCDYLDISLSRLQEIQEMFKSGVLPCNKKPALIPKIARLPLGWQACCHR